MFVTWFFYKNLGIRHQWYLMTQLLQTITKMRETLSCHFWHFSFSLILPYYFQIQITIFLSDLIWYMVKKAKVTKISVWVVHFIFILKVKHAVKHSCVVHSAKFKFIANTYWVTRTKSKILDRTVLAILKIWGFANRKNKFYSTLLLMMFWSVWCIWKLPENTLLPSCSLWFILECHSH